MVFLGGTRYFWEKRAPEITTCAHSRPLRGAGVDECLSAVMSFVYEKDDAIITAYAYSSLLRGAMVDECLFAVVGFDYGKLVTYTTTVLSKREHLDWDLSST